MATDGSARDYSPAEHYDRITAAWRLLLGAELHYGVFDRHDDPLDVATAALTSLMSDAARFEPGLAVLDVGCGSGAPALHLVERFGVDVLGITTSEVGVATAQRNAAARGLDGARFEVRDGTANGLPDASFDRVWVLESSHLMRERDALVSECARVLRPGGRVVLCDLVSHRDIPFAEVRARRADFAVLRQAFGDAHLRTLESYAESFTQHGLAVDVVRDLTEATLPTFDRWRANAERHSAEVVELVGQDELTAFARSCDILEAFWRDGTFGYGLLAAVSPT